MDGLANPTSRYPIEVQIYAPVEGMPVQLAMVIREDLWFSKGGTRRRESWWELHPLAAYTVVIEAIRRPSPKLPHIWIGSAMKLV